MSIVNFEALSKTLDIRIVKTKRSILAALVDLLSKYPLKKITITELCSQAMINRKTFYSHYQSIENAFDDMENLIISGYLQVLKENNILYGPSFSATDFILLTHKLIEADKERFRILYPYLRTGGFLHKLCYSFGEEASNYVIGTKNIEDFEKAQAYIYAFTFLLNGIIISYFDWIDSEMPCTIERLAAIADLTITHPLKEQLKI